MYKNDNKAFIRSRGGTACPACHGEHVPFLADQTAEHLKITPGHVTLQTTHDVGIRGGGDARQDVGDVPSHVEELLGVFRGVRLPRATQENLTRILNLGRHDRPAKGQRANRVGQRFVLSATQEDIARSRSLDAGLEPTGKIEEDDRSAVGCAAMQQGRADGHVAETEDRAKVKQRYLKARLAFEFDLERLVVEVQITPRASGHTAC